MTNQHKYPTTTPTNRRTPSAANRGVFLCSGALQKQGKHPKDLDPPIPQTQKKTADPNYRDRPLNGSFRPNPTGIYSLYQLLLTLDPRVLLEIEGGQFNTTSRPPFPLEMWRRKD